MRQHREAVEKAASSGIPRQPLTGRPTESPWDPALAEAMTQLGVSIHEEALIENLLPDL